VVEIFAQKLYLGISITVLMQEHVEALTSLAGLAMSENGTGAIVEYEGIYWE